MSLDNAFSELEFAYTHRFDTANRWRGRGGKVVGYLCDNVPEELIAAAGFFPLRLAGDKRAGTSRTQQYVIPYIASDRARLKWVDTIIERLLGGEMDCVDYLVIPHNRHAVQSIYHELLAAKQHRPALSLPEIAYLDLAYSPSEETRQFNCQSILLLKQQLESWSGKSISASSLEEAIQEADENRALVAQLDACRRTDPPEITGVQAIQIIGSSFFMEKKSHSALLRGILSHLDKAESHPSLRVFLGGSPQDHTELYRLIEGCDAIIVGEDHCWGSRVHDFPLRTDLDPVDAIAERFHRKPACSIRFPLADTVSASVDQALKARADVAIFCCEQGDRIQAWETPDEIRALEARGIPCLHLPEQDYANTDKQTAARIAAFIETHSRRSS